MLTIPNQLEGAYLGQNVTLECQTEAYPASINYWTTDRGDMIISGRSFAYQYCSIPLGPPIPHPLIEWDSYLDWLDKWTLSLAVEITCREND